MATLPNQESPTVLAIYEHYREAAGDRQPNSIGASWLGKECWREIYYSFRWFTAGTKFDGRMLRLFETGQLEEARVIENLRAIGVEVWDRGDDGKQFGFEDVGGHVAGFADGVCLGVKEAPKTPHVLEVKTCSSKRFAELQAKGVKVFSPEHYAQMILYMHELELTRAIYIAVNKDTDEIYAERIREDKEHALALLDKAGKIILASLPPARVSDDAAFWKCRFCVHHSVCHEWGNVARNCRTCRYSTPEDGAIWRCTKHDKNLVVADQIKGCESYEVIK